jgi:hypothetical protein
MFHVERSYSANIVAYLPRIFRLLMVPVYWLGEPQVPDVGSCVESLPLHVPPSVSHADLHDPLDEQCPLVRDMEILAPPACDPMYIFVVSARAGATAELEVAVRMGVGLASWKMLRVCDVAVRV